MAWISPTGYTASDWTTEEYAYDANTETTASYLVVKASWSPYLILTFPEINCDKVRIWSTGQTTDINLIEVDYYDTGWVNFYSGALVQGSYQEYAIGSTKTITSIRIRYYNSKSNASRLVYCHEVQLNQIAGADFEYVGVATGAEFTFSGTATIIVGFSCVASGGFVFSGSAIYSYEVIGAVISASLITDNLVLHFDASAITGLNDNDLIAQWNDLSGLNNHATQATETNKPKYKTNIVNGLPVVRFDGIDNFFTLGDINPTGNLAGATWIFVLNRRGAGHNFETVIRRNKALQFDLNRPEPFVRFYISLSNTFYNATDDVQDTDKFVNYIAVYDGSALRLYKDGFEVGSNTDLSGNLDVGDGDLLIGSAVGVNFINADIAEILIYSVALSAADRASVEQYLGEKWLGWEPAGDFTCTGSGSFAYSGTATLSYTKNYLTTASGSLAYSGTAVQVYSRNYLYEGSGSLAFSGSAVIIFGLSFVGSGSLAYSGEAVQSYTYNFLSTAVGELIYSGEAIFSYLCNFLFSGTGELAYSGVAEQSYTYNFSYVASGSLTISGEATYFVGFSRIGSGSYNFGGTATQIHSRNYLTTGTGSLAFSGEGSYTLEFSYVSSGSFNYSGEATQSHTKNFIYTASGEFIYSGAAVCSYQIAGADFQYTGSGSFNYSGIGICALEFSYTASGSFTYSGTAVQSYTINFTYLADGTFTFSGAGTCELGFTYITSGQFTYSGSAETSIGLTYIGSGSLAYSGIAVQSYTIDFLYDTSGSLTYSGTAIQTYTLIIDIGSPAIERTNYAAGATVIPKANPANASGNITAIEIFAHNDIASVIIGIFYRPDPDNYPNNLSTRDYCTLANLSAGYNKITVDSESNPIFLNVLKGDFLGIWLTTTSQLDVDLSGEGRWYYIQNKIPCNNFEFISGDDRTYSLYGTGETLPAGDFVYTGIGVFTYSGTAVQTHARNYLYTGSGEFAYSGIAECSYTGEGVYEYVGSGSLAFSGVGIYSIGFSCIGSGTYEFSGVGLYSLGLFYVGSGNFVISGSGIYYLGVHWEYTAGGTLTYSGNADFTYCYHYIKVSKDISTYTKVDKGLSIYTKVDKGTSTYTKVDKGASNYTKVDKEISNYSKVNRGC